MLFVHLIDFCEIISVSCTLRWREWLIWIVTRN